LILQSDTAHRKTRQKLSKADQFGAVGETELRQRSAGLSKRVQSEEKCAKNHASKCKAHALTAAPIARPHSDCQSSPHAQMPIVRAACPVFQLFRRCHTNFGISSMRLLKRFNNAIGRHPVLFSICSIAALLGYLCSAPFLLPIGAIFLFGIGDGYPSSGMKLIGLLVFLFLALAAIFILWMVAASLYRLFRGRGDGS
jgi:hypothetical protein